ncbi:SAF domain-containing protein [Oerskovia sp. M15]
MAARDLDAGTVLDEADLTVVDVVAPLVPGTSLTRVSEAVGRTTSVALPRGLTLTPSLVAAGDLAAAAPSGTVVAPVRLADPAVAALLHPGDRVDLLGAADEGPDGYLRRAARARARRRPGRRALRRAARRDDDEGGVTLVAVLPDEAASLAGLGQWGGLSAVLVP